MSQTICTEFNTVLCRLIRKLDIRMVTLGTLMHMLCVFDRSNMVRYFIPTVCYPLTDS